MWNIAAQASPKGKAGRQGGKMPNVQWVKVNVDMFDNRKIKYLRRLPKGNDLALIWVMLLTLAGRCSADGTISLAENVPYTPDMLADELGFEESTMVSALNTFAKLGMIGENEDGVLFITGWEEHQSLDKLEKIREQTKARVARYRSGRKEQDECNAECNAIDSVTVTQRNATDKNRIEENREEENRTEEIREEKNILSAAEPPKKKQFVPPTIEEVREYCQQRKSGVDPVRFWEYFDTGGWKDSEGKPVKNWKQKLIMWETHNKEKGKENYDSTANSSNSPSKWNIHYTFDGRTL